MQAALGESAGGIAGPLPMTGRAGEAGPRGRAPPHADCWCAPGDQIGAVAGCLCDRCCEDLEFRAEASDHLLRAQSVWVFPHQLGSHTLSLGSINLLERLTELREAFHSLGH